MPKRDQPRFQPPARSARTPQEPIADADPDAPPSEAERAAAESLRDALQHGHEQAEADLARALSAAWNPRDLAPAEHRAIVDAALSRRQARGRIIRVSFGASAIIALAASVMLVVSSGKHPPNVRPSPASIAVSRSTQPLFPDRFAAVGGESARIDRIAMARSTDLRDNEFAKWGVR